MKHADRELQRPTRLSQLWKQLTQVLYIFFPNAVQETDYQPKVSDIKFQHVPEAPQSRRPTVRLLNPPFFIWLRVRPRRRRPHSVVRTGAPEKLLPRRA